jgi:hypothetical protein
LADTITVGTYLETLTVIDSVSATIVQPLTITVNAPPSFSANSALVDSGTVLYLDAGNLQSNTGTGSTWKDISGRALTATFAPSPAPAMNGVTTLSCSAPTYSTDNLGALVFNGASCGYVPNVGLLKVYTYEVWVKRSADMNDYSAVISNPWSGATGQQISITLHWMANGTIQAGIFDGTTWSNVADSPVIGIGVWTHVAVTYTGSTLSMVLNGNIAGKISVARTLSWVDAKNDTGIIIGKRFDLNADYFKGSLASVRIYNRVLTDSELLQNYNSTKGRFLTTQNKQSVAGKYGTTVNETYTVTAGSETVTATFTSSAVAALLWDTSTVRSMKVQLQDSLTAGTYYDTVTVTDIYGSSTRIALSFVIAKADTITVTMDTATVTVYNGSPLTQYPKPTISGLKNSDTATVTTKFSSSTYTLSATAPTNADTYTVTAADLLFQVGSMNNYLNVIYETSTARINKANQRPLNVSLYGAVIGSSFTITLLGGDGDGVVSETLTGVTTAPNCAINNHVLTSSASTISFCELRVTKAESQNYLLESATVQVYFMQFISNQATNQIGGGPGIGLNGATSVSLSPNSAPTISAIENVAAVCINSFCTPEHWIIRGTGFGATNNLDTVVKFWRNKVATMTTNLSGNHVVDNDSIEIWSIPAGATTGKITVTTANGIAVSVDNWIAP